MSEHLPVLQIIVPLLAAGICTLLPRRVAWAWATLVGWSAFAISVALLQRVLTTGPISYELGGWPPPWGIEYRLDPLSVFVVLLVTSVGALVLTYSRRSVEREINPDQHHLFYSSFLVCFTGLLGIVVTGDLFNVFVFLEISSLSGYALVALGRDRRALTAAFRYLVMGSIGATFIVIGIGFLYAMTGTLNMADLAARIPAVSDTTAVLAGFAFLTVGISMKLALVPLHLWLPNAYTFAPTVTSAFLAGTATKVAVYIFLRVFFTIFGVGYAFERIQLDMVLLPLALVAIFTMSLVAIFQPNIKRMLAYSSLAQIGYIILGISLASVAGLTAAILHLFNHALMKSALFMALGCVIYRVGSVRIDSFNGLGKQMPYTMAAFVVGGLSMIGVPLTTGFISKWYLVLAVIERGWWPVAGLVLVTSVMALVYVWRVVESAYFYDDSPIALGREPVKEAPLSLLIPTWILVLANIYFGIDAQFTAGVATRAAEFLLLGNVGMLP